jgi:dihydroorotate dehydrogenase
MNAAGTLGFALDPDAPPAWTHWGAFVTNPISAGRRSPANGMRYRPYSGGFLLHSGYPNPGLKTVVRHNKARWRRAAPAVIAHLLGIDPQEISWMVAHLEGLEGVMGVEVGLPPGVSTEEAASLVQSAVGELPVIVRLPMENAAVIAGSLAGIEVAAFSLAPPRGSLPLPDGARITGRLYGPGVYPMALRTVEELSRIGLPVIGAGGVYRPEEAEAMLRAGALAVQLDAILWRGGWETGGFDPP